jgi:anti-anti-sigma regulatory factor
MCSWDALEAGDQACYVHTEGGETIALHLIRGEGVAHVAVIGELREPQVAILGRCLAALADRGASRLVVDVNRATSMDRAAWQALRHIDAHLRSGGTTLLLRGVDRRSRLLQAARSGLGGGRSRGCPSTLG